MKIKALFTLALAAILGVSGFSVSSPAFAAVPPPTFTFTFDDYGNNTFPNQTSSTALLTPAATCPADPCTATSSFGVDSSYGSYWQWTSTANRGGGFKIDTTGLIGDTYSIAMTFSVNAVSGWRKIIDYMNRADDSGFYLLNGQLQFYPNAAGGAIFAPNDLMNIVVVRDATTNPSAPTFTVYSAASNGTYVQAYTAPAANTSLPYSTNGHTILGFFFDDTATGSEAASAGRIYDLRMWQNTALSSSDLNSVYQAAVAQTTPSASSTSSSSTSSSSAVAPANAQTAELAQTGEATFIWPGAGLVLLLLLSGVVIELWVKRRKI